MITQAATILDCKAVATAFAQELVGMHEGRKVPPLNTEESIKSVFQKHAIPTQKWKEKDLEAFFTQVSNGETVIYVIDKDWTEAGANARVVRFSEVLSLRVFHADGKSEIFEYKQYPGKKDFEPKIESGKVIPGVSEKILIGKNERPVDAAIRCIAEELKLTVSVDRIQRDPINACKLLYKPNDEKGYYIGLYIHNYVLHLNDHDPVSAEYIEQGDRSLNKFVWEPKL